MDDDRVIFALSSSIELGEKVAEHLAVELGEIEIKHFKDGEILVEPQQTVRGRNVFLIQSTCFPVSENLMELLIAIDACKRASAKSITAVLPYYGYARQDRKARPRQPITAKLVADMIQIAGANRVVTVDLHAQQIQGFFNIPNDDLTAVSIIGEYYRDKKFTDEVVVISPDHGGATRARKLANYLHCSIAIVDKRRPLDNEVEALNIVGDVDHKIAVIIDDICDTGGSLLASVDILLEKGAKKVLAAVTHGVLSEPALDIINKSKIEEVVVTDTIPLRGHSPKVVQVSVSDMLAKVIDAISTATPVSEVYDKFTYNQKKDED